MMPLKDPEARKKYHREYMQRRFHDDTVFKQKHMARVRVNDARYRAEVDAVIAAFRSKGCGICSEIQPCCLVAHHLDPSRKDFNIGDARVRKVGSASIQEELEKCVCLCMNCHSKVHSGVLQLSEVVS